MSTNKKKLRATYKIDKKIPLKEILFEAVNDRSLEKTKEILKRGVNVNSRDRFKSTPLHYASNSKNVDMCKLLLNFGADVNAENEYFETPMSLAAENNWAETLEFLKKNGAKL